MKWNHFFLSYVYNRLLISCRLKHFIPTFKVLLPRFCRRISLTLSVYNYKLESFYSFQFNSKRIVISGGGDFLGFNIFYSFSVIGLQHIFLKRIFRFVSYFFFAKFLLIAHLSLLIKAKRKKRNSFYGLWDAFRLILYWQSSNIDFFHLKLFSFFKQIQVKRI